MTAEKLIKICGVDFEAALEMAKDLMDEKDGTEVKISREAGEVHFKVTAQAEDEKEAKKLIKPVVKELKSRFGGNIYSTEPGVTLVQVIVDLINSNRLSLVMAESCTGGMLSSQIVSVPGVSETFKMGFITYSNKAKRKYLGVKKSTLVKYGAVSAQTAKEMAKGACSAAKADVGVAITGIAGPDGGTEEKPVGLVYIGVCVCGTVAVKEFRFDGDRQQVREQSCGAALVLLRSCLLEYFSMKTFSGDDR